MTRSVASSELLRTLIERQLRLRAKRTGFGVLWPIVAPLFLLVLYSFVFHSVFRVPVRHYPVFLFAGLLPWSFLAQTLGQAIVSLSNEPELIRRSRFPYELLPISVTGVMALYFLVTLAGFVIYLAIVRMLTYSVLPALALPVIAVILFVAGVSMVLALIDVYSRDLRAILQNLLTVWFFLVPIVYRPQMAHGWLTRLRTLDPMNLIVSQFRDILYRGTISRPAHLVLMCAVSAAFFVVCLAIMRYASTELPKDV